MPTNSAILSVAALFVLALMGLTVGWLLGRPSEFSPVDPSRAHEQRGARDQAATQPAWEFPPIAARSARPAGATVPPRFVDVAKDHHIDFTYVRGETGQFWLPETMGGGVAWLDYDGDGRHDLYFVQGCQLPEDRSRQFASVLYRNPGAGPWQVVPRFAGPSNTGYGMGATIGDVDNDGFDDVYVTNFGSDAFFQNSGDGTFRHVTGSGAACDLWSTSAAFGDLDQDGDLDLYVATYVHNDPEIRCEDPYTRKQKYCGPDYYEAQDDGLYENLGDGRFRDVSAAAGITVSEGKGLGVVIADFVDEDGRPDIFVSNDLRPNFLFRNSGALESDAAPDQPRNEHQTRIRFQEEGLKLGVALNAEGVREANMGIACGDFDENGYLDLYVTHYFMEHDTLWQNSGSGGFSDVTKRVGLNLPTLQQLSWGTNALDYDRDGWLDLFVTSGHINRSSDGSTVPYAMRPQLFHNDRGLGEERFSEVSMEAGPYFSQGHVGRGSAVADFDADGDVDIAVTQHHEPASLLRNDTLSRGHSLGFRLVGKHSNRSAIGARVTIHVVEPALPGAERRIVREIVGGGSYLSSDTREILAGIGQAERASRVEIRWPSGTSTEYTDLRAGAYYVIREGESAVRSVPFEEGHP